MNKGEFRHVTQKVEYLLRNYPETRNSDAKLYVRVCEMTNPIVERVSFSVVMRYPDKYGIPMPETVRRTRQKLQATYPELGASNQVSAGRLLNEEAYREFAKEPLL